MTTIAPLTPLTSKNFFEFSLYPCSPDLSKKDRLISIISTIVLSILTLGSFLVVVYCLKNRIQSNLSSIGSTQIPDLALSRFGNSRVLGTKKSLPTAPLTELEPFPGEGKLDLFIRRLEVRLLRLNSVSSTAFSAISILGLVGLLLANCAQADKAQFLSLLGIHDEGAAHAVIGKRLNNLRLEGSSGTVTIAQAIASDEGSLDEQLNRILTRDYLGQFISPNPGTTLVDSVNQYIAGVTRGLIPKAIDGDIVGRTLINVVYLNLPFKEPFDDGREFTFTTSQGKKIVFQSMVATGDEFFVSPIEDSSGNPLPFSIFQKAYTSTDGKRRELRILLPNVGATPEAFMPQIADDFRFERPNEDVKLYMPETKVSGDYQDLAQLLRDLGLPVPQNFQVFHKAVVHTSKKGSEAAAVSGFAFRGLSQPTEYIVNRPYGFAIIVNGQSIFSGIVDDTKSIVPHLSS